MEIFTSEILFDTQPALANGTEDALEQAPVETARRADALARYTELVDVVALHTRSRRYPIVVAVGPAAQLGSLTPA